MIKAKFPKQQMSMTVEEKALARIMFHNKVLHSDGQAFENLFTSIIGKKYPDFVQIKPQGPLGDKKNDGYSKANGIFFQVFAPEDARESEAEAVSKVKDSFTGIKAYWDSFCPVKQFFFVLNDKFKGSFPTIEKDLAEIKAAHSLSVCEIFLSKHLEDSLFQLSDDEILSIVGFIPAPEKIQKLDYSIMTEVLTHVMKHKKQLVPDQILSAPDFDEKIRFNGLGKEVGALLTTASYHAGLVDEYFSLNSDFAKQSVRNTLNELYINKAKLDFGTLSLTKNKSDQVFFEILKSTTPAQTEPAQNSALVLMAYFFESCDIFEEPRGI
jgi:hypothetical protein